MSETNTSYAITLSGGDTGVLIFNHDKNNNISAIMVYFDNWQASAAMAIWIGEKIDYKFSSDDAINRIANNKSYSSADMTVTRLDLDTDFEVTVLAPTEFFEDILS